LDARALDVASRADSVELSGGDICRLSPAAGLCRVSLQSKSALRWSLPSAQYARVMAPLGTVVRRSASRRTSASISPWRSAGCRILLPVGRVPAYAERGRG